MPSPQAGKVLAAEIVIGGNDADGRPLRGRGRRRAATTRPTGEPVSRDVPPLSGRVHGDHAPSSRSTASIPSCAQWRPHWGVDLAAPYGTPVRAVADGTVIVSGWESGLGRDDPHRPLGRRSRRPTGTSRAIAPAVVQGAQVERGQVIGYVGSTGLSTGPHLHYEIDAGRRPRRPARVHLRPRAVRSRPPRAGSSTGSGTRGRRGSSRRSRGTAQPTSLVAVDVAAAGGRSRRDALPRRPAPASVRAPRVRRARIPRTRSPSFAAGLAAGADRLELDVHATADGHVVVLHDADARSHDRRQRARSARCRSRRSSGSTPAIASGAPTASHPYRGQGIRVPTLARAARRASRTSPLNIEIKQDDPPIATACSPMLDAFGARERTLLAAEHARHHGRASARRRPTC